MVNSQTHPRKSRELHNRSASGLGADRRRTGPVGDDEIEGLFERFHGHNSIALAVSGGADSTALLVLAARWRSLRASRDGGGADAKKPDLLVLTVDHSLRPEAHAEVAAVIALSQRFGLPCQSLTREGAKPKRALQAALREARYRLILEAAARAGATAVATAHTLEDQAETLLMRLARGSGIDGLACMAPESGSPLLGHSMRLLRPFLELPKERLVATLEALGIGWAADPTNADPTFERVRWRQRAPALVEMGLSPKALSTSARRLWRAREALERATLVAMRRLVEFPPAGYAAIDRAGLRLEPDEIQLRLIGRCLDAVGGPNNHRRLERLERLLSMLNGTSPDPMRATLQGCLVIRRPERIDIVREVGRAPMQAVPLSPGDTIVWDGRFRISTSPNAADHLFVGPATAKALRSLPAEVAKRAELMQTPWQALMASPVIWRFELPVAMLAASVGLPGVDWRCLCKDIAFRHVSD
jgi:tRNA(Ile)-lysidine synthase